MKIAISLQSEHTFETSGSARLGALKATLQAGQASKQASGKQSQKHENSNIAAEWRTNDGT